MNENDQNDDTKIQVIEKKSRKDMIINYAKRMIALKVQFLIR